MDGELSSSFGLLRRLTDDCVPLSFFDDTFTSLSLSGSKLTGGMIVKIVSICSQLQHLDISSCFQVTNDTLITVLRTCPRLTSLSIRNCRKLSDMTLQYLTEVQQEQFALPSCMHRKVD